MKRQCEGIEDTRVCLKSESRADSVAVTLSSVVYELSQRTDLSQCKISGLAANATLMAVR